MAGEKEKLIKRSQKVAYMNTASAEGPASFERMTGFTALTNAKNSKEYSRQYVDMDSEISDVVGYAPAIDYTFDRYEGNPVHEKIAKIHDEELLGNDTHVDIVTVDLFKKSSTGEKYYAIKRTYAVIPDSDGDGTDALVYSGSLKAVTELTVGNVTFAGGDFKKATFAEGAYDGE